MTGNNKSYRYKNLGWATLFTLSWVVLILLIGLLIILYKISFGLIMLLLGVLGTLFNRQLYEYMVKLNIWSFEKMGNRKIGEQVKSISYRKLFRISTFLFGLVALYFGITEVLLYYGIDLRTFFK